MAYATTGDVATYCGRGEKLLSASSPLTIDELNAIIDGVAHEIDGILAGIGVPLPVSSGDSPLAFATFRLINTVGAAAAIELRLFGEAAPAARGTTRHEILRSEYQRMLKLLREGVYVLDTPDGPQEDSRLVYSGSLADEYGNTKRPIFTRSQKY